MSSVGVFQPSPRVVLHQTILSMFDSPLRPLRPPLTHPPQLMTSSFLPYHSLCHFLLSCLLSLLHQCHRLLFLLLRHLHSLPIFLSRFVSLLFLITMFVGNVLQMSHLPLCIQPPPVSSLWIILQHDTTPLVIAIHQITSTLLPSCLTRHPFQRLLVVF